MPFLIKKFLDIKVFHEMCSVQKYELFLIFRWVEKIPCKVFVATAYLFY